MSGSVYAPLDDVVLAWVENNGCQTESTFRAFDDIESSDQSTVELHTFSGCEQYPATSGIVEAEVQLFKIISGNHQWPGGASPSPLNHGALQPRNDDISASREMWEFFSRHRLPAVDREQIGDFDGNGAIDSVDIDLLVGALLNEVPDLDFDVNEDGVLNDLDHSFLVTESGNILMGDADLDGSVRFPDFLRVSANFGGVGGWAEGNFTTDTEVNFADFLILSANFGSTQVAAAPVPEPSANLLLTLGGLVGLGARSRGD